MYVYIPLIPPYEFERRYREAAAARAANATEIPAAEYPAPPNPPSQYGRSCQRRKKRGTVRKKLVR